MYAFAANIGLGPGRRRGAQLLLSTPLATDFGPVPQGGGGGGAQLDGEFAFYAFRRQHRAWPEGAMEGCAAGRGVCFLRLSPPTSGLARRGRRGGAQLDGEFAFYASRHRLRVWPGRDRGGAQLDGEFAFYASRHRLWAWPGGGG